MDKAIGRFPCGAVAVPPSKSLSHRALICAALAGGGSVLRNLALSEDISVTLEAVKALGARHTRNADGTHSLSGGLTRGGTAAVDCGESGSSLRFLAPVAAALGIKAVFGGRGRLMDRPMEPYTGLGIYENGAVTGVLTGGRYTLPGDISSQFVSGLLMALPLTDEGGEVFIEGTLESSSYVLLTIEVMRAFGVAVERDGFSRFRVPAGQSYRPSDYTVEADYSQAAFFLAAAALGCPVECIGLSRNSPQGDRAVLDCLRLAGAEILPGPSGGITAEAKLLKPVEIDVSDTPDLVPPLAALLCFCEGESRLYGAARLRLKESDRLAALESELNKLGGKVTAADDALRITGVKALNGGTVHSWNDHRIAMALAVAAIRGRGTVTVTGASAVNKSYPGFWDDFEKGGKPE